MSGSQNVSEFLLSGKAPDRLALRFLDADYTYGDLERAAHRLARYVEQHTSPGDRVLLIADNSLFWVAGYLGVMRAGRIVVPLPAGIAAVDLHSLRQTTEAAAALVQAAVLARHPDCFAGMPVVTDRRARPAPGPHSQRAFQDLEAGTDAAPHASGDDLAALMFTSGSTGHPRGVMISHGNLIANTESIVEYLRLTASDRIMAVLPFHYCFGASLLHTHLRIGGSLVVDPRFMYPEVVLDRMIETECTGFAGVPSHFQLLLRSSGLRRRSFPRLRYVQQAGGGLSKAFLRELRQALPETEIFVMYGQTEATARLSYLPPELLESKLGSIGKGIPGVRLQVLNERGEPVQPGETGEIVAEGANVAQGYWREPDESAATFRQSGLYTGDVATVDEDGFLYIVDRAKDFLKCRGERVSCRQIEERLLECEDLLEAAVIGVPDEILGEAVKAFVVGRTSNGGGLTGTVLAFCRERLPPHLLPKEIVPLPSLPKNSAGKVLKAALRA